MNSFRCFAANIGCVASGVLCVAVTGCTTYVEQPRPRAYYPEPPPPREVYVPPPAPVYSAPPPVVYTPPPAVEVDASVSSDEVVIRSEDDFYEPLSQYGRWEVVGSYGRCWIPERVDRGWRPYCNGNWERTDAGWYWASEEPWAWATYHYGRWDLSPQFGWYWVPQTQWAPAWVSWHQGGGYVGWAPLQPSVRISMGGSVAVNVALIAPQAFVFVEPRRFLQPVRPNTVVVNNTTIVNQTVNITNIKVVNNTVINEGPRTQSIEQASGQQVRAVAVRELRRKQEAEVVTHERAAARGHEKKDRIVRAPIGSQPEPRETKAQFNGQQDTRQAAAPAPEPSQQTAQDARRAAQLESQRHENEAAAKAQSEARIQATQQMERTAELKAQERAKDSERMAQSQAQVAARELENKTRAESQRHANEVAASARAQSQRDADQANRAAQLESRRQANETGAKAQEEARIVRANAQTRGKQSEQILHGNSVGRLNREQTAGEQDKTNVVKRVSKKKTPVYQPLPSPASENPSER